MHHAGLADRVYGPALTLRVLRACAAEGLPIYLYGSTPSTLDRLVARLGRRLPALKIAGAEPSKFRAARPGEDAEIAERITDSGARLVLVGLGCPRQEVFAHALRPLLDMPVLAVGAAFDYHAGGCAAAAAGWRGPVWSGPGGWPRSLPAVAALPAAEPGLPVPARGPEGPAVAGQPGPRQHGPGPHLRRLTQIPYDARPHPVMPGWGLGRERPVRRSGSRC